VSLFEQLKEPAHDIFFVGGSDYTRLLHIYEDNSIESCVFLRLFSLFKIHIHLDYWLCRFSRDEKRYRKHMYCTQISEELHT